MTACERAVEDDRQIVQRCGRTGVRTRDRAQAPDRPLIEAGFAAVEVELDHLASSFLREPWQGREMSFSGLPEPMLATSGTRPAGDSH
jgi:hypothetical protein